MEILLKFLKKMESDEYIWWSGINEKGYQHNHLFYKFLRGNKDVQLCVHNNKWFLRNIINRLPSFLKSIFDKNQKPYISKYFINVKRILIATNSDVGIKELNDNNKSIIKKYQNQFNFSEIGRYILQNPESGIGFPHIRDSFNSIPSHQILYSKGLSIDDNPQLRPLPNGINWEDARNKVEFMRNLYKTKKQNLNLLYINLNKPGVGSFGQNTNDERPKLIEMFKNENYVTNGEGRGTKFLEEIYHHSFCLSPEGNCADSHRTWEALYLGTIPIVKKSKAMSWFEDLPILQVDRWEQIDDSFLKEQYEIMSKKQYNFQKLKMSYYINLMKSDLVNKI